MPRVAVLLAALLAGIVGACLAGPAPAAAAEPAESHLTRVTRSGKLRVCQYTQYFSISYKDPKTGQIVGIDADLARELAKELGAELEIVESGFSTFVADLQADKCDIGMFGVGATLKRAQAVEFSKPYLVSSVYAVAKQGGPVQRWADLDKKGNVLAVSLGSFIEPFMKSYLKQATVLPVAPPATREQEVLSGNATAMVTDYPTVVKLESEFDWVLPIEPDQPLSVTPYAYCVMPGDQVWLNYINLFVDTIKLDGRLKKYAELHKLGPIVAP